jgi:hypothetical protein
VAAVEADELVQERGRAVACFVAVDGGEAEPGAVVDSDEQVLPAGLPFLLASAVAGDAVARFQDPAQLLDVDMDQVARAGVLVADHLFRLRPGRQAGAAVAAQDRMHRGGSDPDRPADHVRPFLQLLPGPQDRLLDGRGRQPGREPGPARAVQQRFTPAAAVDPLRRRLAAAANHHCRPTDRDSGSDQIAQPLPLTHRQHRICMKMHRAPLWTATL